MKYFVYILENLEFLNNMDTSVNINILWLSYYNIITT